MSSRLLPLLDDSDDVDDTYRLTPLRPLPELRRVAASSRPPVETGTFAPPDLVELRTLDASLRYDIRYATERNFLGVPLYPSAHAFLQRPAAEALVRVQAALAREGYGLVVYDAYRPWSITKLFWEATPAPLREYVADPARGSRHNRGAAVDVGLVDRASGRVLPMPSGYDEFSERAHIDYEPASATARAHRALLRTAMECEGFAVYPSEWWHYDFTEWHRYPILNVSFEEILAGGRAGTGD